MYLLAERLDFQFLLEMWIPIKYDEVQQKLYPSMYGIFLPYIVRSSLSDYLCRITPYNMTVEPFFHVLWDEFYRAAKPQPIDHQHVRTELKMKDSWPIYIYM